MAEEEEEAAWDRGGRARRQTACNSLSLSLSLPLPPLLHCCFGGGEGDMGIALKRGGGGRPRRGARHERRWGGLKGEGRVAFRLLRCCRRGGERQKGGGRLEGVHTHLQLGKK